MRSECNLFFEESWLHSIERNSPAKIEERHDWIRKWENTATNFLTNCVFLDESAFDINMKRSRAWSQKRYACHCYSAYYESKHNIGTGCYLSCRFDHSWRKKIKTCKEEKEGRKFMDNAPIHTHENIRKLSIEDINVSIILHTVRGSTQ
ncbi:hypothetical protein BDF20DRAFT_342833 [Mycotypha africana]|uniref:uncharacterized protein n=1 Tax=Mycotypha africana TaxID=64632 RepID=UPI0023013868|nr:uncharacterized protein BDF20DRAFT_342833 [Mycotypha africana]KAI8988606.1 hypothetical protein BDF20DRAFT_342833 [Mycotypha africana]